LGATALASIIGLGIVNYRFWQTIQTAKVEGLEANKRTYLLKSQDSPTAGTAKLVVNPNQLNATLTVNNLKPLPPEKVYALWTVVGKDAPYTTDEKGAILTRIFEVNKSSDLSTEIAVPQPYQTGKAIKKIAITVEDKSAPQAHAGSILIATDDLTK
jgi:Anti-sigma-K factor rskA